MSCRLAARVSGLAVCALVCGGGCVDLCDSVADLPAQGAMRVTILARYAPGGEYAYDSGYLASRQDDFPGCSSRDGLDVGGEIVVRIAERFSASPSCAGLALSVESSRPALTLGPYVHPDTVPSVVAASHRVVTGTCNRQWTLWLSRTDGTSSWFAASRAGSLPAVVAVRDMFNRDPGGEPPGCASCSDQFVVKLERLP